MTAVSAAALAPWILLATGLALVAAGLVVVSAGRTSRRSRLGTVFLVAGYLCGIAALVAAPME